MRWKKIIITSIIIMIILDVINIKYVFADVPYSSYAYGPDKKPFRIQTPYMPVKVAGNILYKKDDAGNAIKVQGLSTPSGIFIDNEDNIFIADTGNNRVVKMDDAGFILEEFGTGDDPKSKLKAPEGVYVSENGDVYVADTANQRIAIFNSKGSFMKEFKDIKDVRLKNIMFTPLRISIDLRGFLFVVLKGGNEGMVILTPEGKFQGFYGRNLTDLSFIERIKRKLFTKKQVETNSNKEAPSVSDVFIGKDYCIYSCTQNVTKGQIKKLNSSGEDLLNEKNMKVDNPALKAKGGVSIAGITVDKNGIIYAIDRNNGLVFQYDNNGEILASFGTKLTDENLRIGAFSEPTGIAVNSTGKLYVLDKTYNGMHVFRPTDFIKKIQTATNLYNDGEYLQVKPYWEDILKSNVFYYKANLGLGKSYYKNKQWKESMNQMKIAKNQLFYSEALWQLRVEWEQKYFSYIVLGIAFIILLILIKGKIKKKKLKKMKKGM